MRDVFRYYILMFAHALIYLLAFLGIWIGSGLAIRSVERLSRKLKASSFALSFLILGVFTSIGELSVGVNSILGNDPEIYVGNLVGATIVIFMLIIPLLAIVGKSIKITPEFQGFNLPASLVVIALPVLLALDGKVGLIDSELAVILFIFLLISIQLKKGIGEGLKSINSKTSASVGRELLRIVFGVVTIFVASRYVVLQTLYFSEQFGVSPFVVSLLVIGLGTNIPELSLVFRSAMLKNTQVAFGDYVGSAAFNTFLLGTLTLAYGKTVILSNSYVVSLVFMIIGLAMFYYFARTKNEISRREGLIMLVLYFGFVVTEILVH